MEDVIILGSGPAGLTAAIYAARARLNPLVLTGSEPGGQVTLTSDIENFPGFPDGISGMEMYDLFRRQAEKFGARLEMETVEAVDLRVRPFVVNTGNNTYQAKTLIIATGSAPRKLNVPGEKELTGRGVSYCATCDGFFFQDQPVAVIGGGDSALDEGLFLTRFASQVTIIHRRDQLRASKILQERAFRNPKVTFLWNTVVEEVLGEDSVRGLKVRNVKDGQVSELEVRGVFVFIGHVPNTSLFTGQLELDANGYIVTDRYTRTSVPGVFACGDVQDPRYRQAITAAGTGAMAAIEAERYLAELSP
ncbi:MAG: thioredoxin-disulfide reductase [candidate division KSB1 bacterium]|nr:thioredoxin-disulfide reductase [candidate division KSB1 bacterium]